MSNKTVHRIQIVGTTEAYCGDISIKTDIKTGVVPVLCRKMLSEGIDPGDEVEIYRNDTPVFSPSPISWWAERQVKDHDEKGLSIQKYVHFNSKGVLKDE